MAGRISTRLILRLYSVRDTLAMVITTDKELARASQGRRSAAAGLSGSISWVAGRKARVH